MAQPKTSEGFDSSLLLLNVETSSHTDRFFGNFSFNADAYVRHVGEWDWPKGSSHEVTVSFLPYSETLLSGISRGHVDKLIGGNYHRRGEQIQINLYMFDNLLQAERNNSSLNFELNESFAHENGHMYEDIVLGEDVLGRSRRFYRAMKKAGLSLYTLGYTMSQYETAQEMLPVYTAYPLATVMPMLGSVAAGWGLIRAGRKLDERRYRFSPHEAFANNFSTDFKFPEFIYAEPARSR